MAPFDTAMSTAVENESTSTTISTSLIAASCRTPDAPHSHRSAYSAWSKITEFQASAFPRSLHRQLRIQLFQLRRRQNPPLVHRQVLHLPVKRSRIIETEARGPDVEGLIGRAGVSQRSAS